MTRIALAIGIALVLATGCTGGRALAPTGPQTVAELRDACVELDAADGVFVRIDQITGRIDDADLDLSVGTAGGSSDAFDDAAAGADGVWFYDATERMATMLTGERGIVALTGCRIVAQQTQIIFN